MLYLYDSFGGPLQLGVVLVGPPKKDRNKHKKTKKIGPSVFTLIYFPDVGLSVFPDFHLYLTNYTIKLIYMHIIRTGFMRRLKLCALFVVSTYISRVINENVRKMAKTKTLNFKFMR